MDPIVGLDTSYILSESLRDYLTNYGITYLAKAQNLEGDTCGLNYWYSASDLHLGAEWVEQWTDFIKYLTHGGIKIRNAEDSFLWMYNKKMLWLLQEEHMSSL